MARGGHRKGAGRHSMAYSYIESKAGIKREAKAAAKTETKKELGKIVKAIKRGRPESGRESLTIVAGHITVKRAKARTIHADGKTIRV